MGEVKAGPSGRRGRGASVPAEEVGWDLWLKACPLACLAAVQNGGTTPVAAWQGTGQGEHDGKGTTGVRRLGCLLTGWWCWAGLGQGAAERAGLGQVGRAGEAGPAVQAGPDWFS